MKKLIKMSAFILMVSLMTSMTVNAKEKILIGSVNRRHGFHHDGGDI